MNPLKSIPGTIISGFVVAIVLMLVLGTTGTFNPWQFWVWMHVLAGITWIGLLYYFNFIQVPGVGKALAEADEWWSGTCGYQQVSCTERIALVSLGGGRHLAHRCHGARSHARLAKAPAWLPRSPLPTATR